MSIKKTISLMVMLAVLGSGFALAQGKKQNQVQSNQEARNQNRSRYMDQNGDGINDFQRDHDNDGVPNCQDKDWARPENGTGNKNRLGQAGGGQNLGQGQGQGQGPKWNRASFRNGGQQGSLGGGVCDGTGAKGKSSRKGRR